mmetsp:Transcript_109858/g.316278  ORF Transcript_109858/g.316278 Transcript_109858/m.316278 type:complete len:291 (+) Transcript_109858:282-1154(+)
MHLPNRASMFVAPLVINTTPIEAKIVAKCIHSRKVRSLLKSVFGCTATIALRTGRACVPSGSPTLKPSERARRCMKPPPRAAARPPAFSKRGASKPPPPPAGTDKASGCRAADNAASFCCDVPNSWSKRSLPMRITFGLDERMFACATVDACSAAAFNSAVSRASLTSLVASMFCCEATSCGPPSSVTTFMTFRYQPGNGKPRSLANKCPKVWAPLVKPGEGTRFVLSLMCRNQLGSSERSADQLIVKMLYGKYSDTGVAAKGSEMRAMRTSSSKTTLKLPSSSTKALRM